MMSDSIESLVPEEKTLPRFTIRHELVIWFSVTFYVADLCLDLWVCAAHFDAGRPRSAWFIFFCILLPNLYAGYKSLQWYLRAHEILPIRRPSVWIIRVLFFPISPILRYMDAWIYGRRARQHWHNHNLAQERKNFENYLVENAEVALLRLVIIFLEDAPIVVLNLAQLLETPPGMWAMIPASRVVAYALFWVVHFGLLWVPILVRWMMHTLWIYFDVAEMSLVNSIAFGGVYLFSFVTTSPGRQILRITLYYVITFGEHIIIAIIWHFGAPDNYFHTYGIGVMFGGTAGGVLFLTLYYSCCHPDKETVWIRQKLREVQDKARARRESRTADQLELP